MEPRLLYSADIAAGLALAVSADTGVEQRTLTDGGEYAASTSSTPSVQTAYAALNLSFEANEGQAGAGIDYLARGSGYGIALGDGNAVLTLLTDAGERSVSLTLTGANDGAIARPENLLATRSNAILGNDASQWRTDLANYGAVTYQQVYDGVDVRYYGTQRQLEYDFIVAPGADTAAIRLQFGGVDSVQVADNGDLVLHMAGTAEEVRFKAPVSYQRGADGSLEAVASRYELHADGSVGFALGAYDPTRELVIDPVLNYATYFGGSNAENATGVTTDAAGNVYITGRTTSSSTPLAALVGGGGGSGEMFVAKLNADLSAVLFSTRIGGNGDEQGKAIAVDAAGNIAVTGWTKSSNFPTLAAADSAISGGQDAVVFKLDSAGALVFSSYFGGQGATDSGNAVGFDGAGNVYVAGQGSDTGLLPLVLQLLFGSSDNAFVNKYGAAGGVVWQELLGGSGNDYATGLAVGAGGDVYVVGNTESGNMSTVGAQQSSLSGAIDGFLTHLGASGATTLYSTYIGGNDADTVTAVAIDGAGKAYVVGESRWKPSSTFTTTANAFMTSGVGSNHDTGFLRIYDTTKTGAASLAYSTFLGGSSVDTPTGVATAGGKAVVVGQANSTTNFPLTADAVQSTNTGSAMFLLVINPVGGGAADLQYGTFYGSGMTVGGVALRGNEAYVAAATTANGLATTGSAQALRAGNDAFVAAFRVFPNAAPVLTSVIQPAPILEDGGGGSIAVTSLGTATDADGDIVGVAIVAADNSHGTWLYSLDGGTTWTAMGALSATSALLLPGDGLARVGFVPAADYSGTVAAGLTFRAWDRTSGIAGGLADTSSNGGTTAFGATTAAIDVVVTPVNDAPVLSGVVQPPAILEDSSGGSGFLVTSLLAGQVTDVDSGALRGIAVTGVDNSNGSWEYTLDGSTWTAFGAASGTSARLLAANATASVRFVPNANWNGTVANGLTFRAWDQSSGSAGGLADTTVNGGASAFSSATRSAALTVSPVDDPVFWLTTEGNVASPSGVPGLDSWQDGDVLQFGGANLGLEPGGTTGTMSFVFNIDQFAANGAAEIDALHYVGRDVLVGVSSTFQLRAGDVLFSTVLVEDLSSANTITGVQDSDLVLFRPTTPGNYNAGTFTILLDESAVSAANDWLDLAGVALVEADTVVGGTTVRAGTFLLVEGAVASRKNIQLFTPDKVGATTDGTLQVLFDGTEGGLATAVDSLDFLEEATTIGGTTLAAGTLLLSQDGSADVVALAATGTELAGAGVSAGTRTTLLTGSSVGLDTAAENLWALALVPNPSPANQPPTLTTLAAPVDSAAEDTTVEITLAELKAQANEADADGTVDAFVVKAVTSGTLRIGASAATASLWAAGTNDAITAGLHAYWTPAANDNGSLDAFTVVARDDGWAQSATPVQVKASVSAVNDVPVAVGDTVATAEDNALNINVGVLLGNDTDPEGSSPVIASVSNGVGGTVSWSGGGVITFTPDANFNGAATFFYTVTDGTATSAPGLVTVNVAAVNDSPVAVDDVRSTVEDTPITFTAADLLGNDSDVEGSQLVIESVNTSRAVLNADGSVTFTPDANVTGPVTFKYRISDGTSTSNLGTVTVNITPVDDVPTTTPVVLAPLAEDGSRTITRAQLLANVVEVDGDVLAVGSLAASSGTLVDNGNGTWTFTPGANDDTAVGFTYTISDGTTTIAGSASLDLTPGNDAPTTTPVVLPARAEDSGAVTITSAQLLANVADIDSAAFTVSAVAASSGTLVDNGNGTWTFTPAANDDSAASFTYTISDGAATVAGNASLDFTPVNDAPTTATVVLPALAEDSGAVTITSVQLLANAADIDGAALGVSGLAASSGTLVDNGNGTWSFTAAANDDGTVAFSYTISDGAATVAGSASLDLTPVNDAPTSAPVVLPAMAEDGGTVTITSAQLVANAADIDGGPLVVTGLSASSGTLVDNGNGTWTFTPAANDDSLVAFTYTISDGSASVAGSASLDLAPVNDAPTTATVVLPSRAEDSGAVTITSAQLLANVADIDSASFAVSGVAASSGTLVDNGNGTWTFTAAADDDTAVSFTYTISDAAATVAGSASLDLTPVNDAPTTTPVVLPAVAEDSGALTITSAQLLASAADIDGGSLGVAGLVASSGTLVDNGNGTWTFTPGANDDGVVSFSYTISDGMASVAGSASLDLTPVNDAPTTTPVVLPALAEDGGAVTITSAQLLANVVDIDSATFTVSAVTASSGTLVDNGNGTWTFTPAANDDSAASFSYTISDGAATVSGTASLELTPVNDAPNTTAVVLPAATEDLAITITSAQLLANVVDIDSSAFTVSGLVASSGTLVDNGDGTWTFTPAANDDGAVGFSYSISDGAATVAGTASLDLAPVNDAPTTTPVVLPVTSEDGGAVTITSAQLLANVVDIDSAAFTASGVSASSGTLVDNGNGTWTFTPAANDDGAVTFTYTIGDGLATVAGSASLDLAPVNDAPATTPVVLPAVAEDSAWDPLESTCRHASLSIL